MEVVSSICSVCSCYIASCIHKEKRDPVSTCEYCNCPWRAWRYVSLIFLLSSFGVLFFVRDMTVILTVLLFSGFSTIILGYSFYAFPALCTRRDICR